MGGAPGRLQGWAGPQGPRGRSPALKGQRVVVGRPVAGSWEVRARSLGPSVASCARASGQEVRILGAAAATLAREFVLFESEGHLDAVVRGEQRHGGARLDARLGVGS